MYLKLNLGSGYQDAYGWEHVDKVKYHANQKVADVLVGLPYPAEHFDFVLMNHTLQMFTYEELPIVLKEVRRVMKEGATLRILSPDLQKAVKAWQTFNYDYFPISDDIEKEISAKFARYIFWHGDTRCAFTWTSLSELLEKNGFKNVGEGVFGECELDTRESESIIIEADK